MKRSRLLFSLLFISSSISLSSFAQSGNKSVSLRVGNIIVADRNLGESVPQGGVALNYSKHSVNADHKNSSFEGDRYTWKEAQTACPNGWRLPTRDELEVIGNKLQFSAKTVYFSDGIDRCYFPLCWFNSNRNVGSGHYWSSTPINRNRAYSLLVGDNNSTSTGWGVDWYEKSDRHSVRCVKTVSQ